MSLILDNYKKLEEKIKELEKERERSIGILTELRKRMSHKYGIRSLKQLKRKLKKLKEEEQNILDEYLAKKTQFVKKWKHLLEEKDD